MAGLFVTEVSYFDLNLTISYKPASGGSSGPSLRDTSSGKSIVPMSKSVLPGCGRDQVHGLTMQSKFLSGSEGAETSNGSDC